MQTDLGWGVNRRDASRAATPISALGKASVEIRCHPLGHWPLVTDRRDSTYYLRGGFSGPHIELQQSVAQHSLPLFAPRFASTFQNRLNFYTFQPSLCKASNRAKYGSTPSEIGIPSHRNNPSPM